MNCLRVATVVLLLVCLPWSGIARADWTLDSVQSVINFVSIKNSSVAESHSFGKLTGTIDAAGKVQVQVDLNSLETQIEIRNERMRDLLFETATFPVATATAAVPPALLAQALAGDTVVTDLPIILSLHGQQREQTASVVAFGHKDGHLIVLTKRPLLINAADFGLRAGVATLQKMAGLQSISSAVPVSLQLVFVKNTE